MKEKKIGVSNLKFRFLMPELIYKWYNIWVYSGLFSKSNTGPGHGCSYPCTAKESRTGDHGGEMNHVKK